MRPILLPAAFALACNDDLPSVSATNNRPGVETRSLELCVDGDATEGFASFVVSNVDGDAIAASDTTIDQLVDGDNPGSGIWEGGVSLDEESLTSNLHVTLLLDSSDSIIDAELFELMKDSAQDLLRQGEADWAKRPGEFTWQVIWFSQWVSEAGEGWEFEDIADIPPPPADSDGFTRLYSSMDFAIRSASQDRRDGIADGERDTHLLAVFTDGRDNISGRDSSEPPTGSGVTENGAPFDNFATSAIELEELESLMLARPWLQVSLLGLGNDIDSDALNTLARAGGGRVFRANDIEVLFDRAEAAFEIRQTVGWRLPFNPGERHRWQLDFTVDGLDRPARIRLDVEREVDDDGEDLLPECTDEQIIE